MRIYNLENSKLTNIKPNHFSNYSKYKNILSHNLQSKSNSVNDMINKMYLKKNNKNSSNSSNIKRTLLNQNMSIPILNTNEFSLGTKKNEKIIQRYYMNEKNIFKNLLKRFIKFKENNNPRNFSFTNNFINSKVTQYEEKLKFNRNKQIGFSVMPNESKSFWNEKNEETKFINYPININKNNIEANTNRTNINIKENLNDEEISKIRITNIKNKGFNKVLNKYISKSIINNLQSFNRIRHLIKLNGFSLNLNDIKNLYKENDIKPDKENLSSRIDTQKVMRIKRLEKIERLKKDKNDSYQNLVEKEKSEDLKKKISRNKILPLIKSEIRDKPNKLRIILNLLNNKNEDKGFKLINKEIIIKREVNKFYKENDYKSFKEFYKDWLKNNKNYLTINDIEFFLNKIIKISISLSREEIIKIFFNESKIDEFDFYSFKKFFRPYDINDKNEQTEIKGEMVSNEELLKYENKICLKILKSKDILLDKLEDLKGTKTFRNNNKYFLNFEEFHNLIRNNLIIFKNNYFDFVIRKIFNDNFDLRTKKINVLNFIYKLDAMQNNLWEFENNNNNSEVLNNFQNQTRKKYFHRINSLKDDIKISFKNKILGKEENLNNSEKKITNFVKLDKGSINNINNNIEKNYLEQFPKLNISKIDSENLKKNKNSDIINLI